MSKPEILLVEPMMPAIEARLDADYTVHRLFDPAGRDSALAARPADPALSPLAVAWDRQRLDQADARLGIAINGVGTDRVDLALARVAWRRRGRPPAP